MASFDSFGPTFEKDTPILNFPHRGGFDPVKPKWVAYPVFAWRVVAPVPKERKLNLFQRAVLGLARAKVTAIVDIADRLLIAPDLAGLVVLELQNMALLDHAGEPTARGIKMLDDIEEDPQDEAQVGHVLTDPFTGKVWPRFLTGDLPIADVEIDDRGWPTLQVGSRGAPRPEGLFIILPQARDAVVSTQPSRRDVLRAARRHRRQRDYDEVDDDRDVPRLQRVSFVDDRPQPYLLALRVRRHHSGDWMVDDPFGHGEAIDLRARMEERLDSHKGLRPWLAPLVGSDPSAPTLVHLQTEATWEVEERLTLAIRQHETVRERLVAMQRALLEAESHDAPPDKWDDVLVKGQRAIEHTLNVVHGPYAGTRPPYFEDLDREQKFSALKIVDAAQAVGLSGDVPPRLLSIRRNQVRDAEQGKRGSLRSLLVLSLIAARWNDDHPMRRAIKSHPALVSNLDDLATDRNQAAHDGAATWSRDVQRHVDTVYTAVNALLLHR